MEKAEISEKVFKWKLVVSYNLITRDFQVDVEPDSLFVGLALARYAEMKLRRADQRAEIMEQMKNAPRIAVPGGPLG